MVRVITEMDNRKEAGILAVIGGGLVISSGKLASLTGYENGGPIMMLVGGILLLAAGGIAFSSL